MHQLGTAVETSENDLTEFNVNHEAQHLRMLAVI